MLKRCPGHPFELAQVSHPSSPFINHRRHCSRQQSSIACRSVNTNSVHEIDIVGATTRGDCDRRSRHSPSMPSGSGQVWIEIVCLQFRNLNSQSSTQPNPSDLNAVCSGSNATDVKQYINSHCGNNVNAAMSTFSSVCSGAGIDLPE